LGEIKLVTLVGWSHEVAMLEDGTAMVVYVRGDESTETLRYKTARNGSDLSASTEILSFPHAISYLFKFAGGGEKAFLSMHIGEGHLYTIIYQNGKFDDELIRVDEGTSSLVGVMMCYFCSYDLAVSSTDKAMVVYTKPDGRFTRRNFLNKYDGTQWLGSQVLEPNYESRFPRVFFSRDGKRGIVSQQIMPDFEILDNGTEHLGHRRYLFSTGY